MVKKKKKKTGLIVLIIILCVAAAAGGLYLWKFRSSSGSDEKVYVQSVGEITGLGSTGTVSRYAGIIQAKDVVKINPENDMKVKECFVKAGDNVAVGTPLFCYDTAELTLAYEQLLIDIMGLENTIESDTRQIERLDKKIAKAKESAIYELELKRSEVSLDLKKSQFSLTEKREKAATTKSAIDNATVVSPCGGRVKSVKSDTSEDNPYSMSSSSDDAYITIISGSALWVKCTVSEQTVHALNIGERMKIISRADEEDVRSGYIDSIVTDTPESSNSSYYDGGNSEKSAKYPFYVVADNSDGYLLGQHVMVEPDYSDAEKSGLWMPKAYIAEEGGKPFVYAANASNRIEKRAVTLGEYDEATDTVLVKAGLKLTDRIAFPGDTVTVGAKAEEYVYAEETPSEDNPSEFTPDEEYYEGETDGEEYGEAYEPEVN